MKARTVQERVYSTPKERDVWRNAMCGGDRFGV